jgi:CubicO group peptidase (beta-lactamase class C family)
MIYSEAIGFQDKAAGKPMTKDAIFRIYSMTKPLASVAAMMLVEEGRMQLTDPVSKFLPQLAKMQVLATDKDGKTTREIAKRSCLHGADTGCHPPLLPPMIKALVAQALDN